MSSHPPEPLATPPGDGEDASADPRDQVRERTRRQLLAVAVSAAVLVVAGVVSLVLLGGGDEVADEQPGPTTRPGDDPVAPDTPGDDPAVPDDRAVPDGDELPPGLDTGHPLVGRSELEAREVYPLVRSEWVDGEAMMLTMDLVPGRVGVAVEDGVIVAAGAEGCEDLPADPAVWQRQACSPSEGDGATVWGRLVEREGGLALEPGEGADRYYEYLQVVPFSAHPDRSAADGAPVAVDLRGQPVDEDDLQAGQSVWLWIRGGCEERYPVGCTVDALVVER
jgi:hypothetical protein